MPVYDYRCRICQKEQEEFRYIAERKDSPICCGQRMDLQIKGSRTNTPSSYPYYDNILEREITGPGQKQRILKELGLEQKC